MATTRPMRDATGRSGITQVIDGIRYVLVEPDSDGAPGVLTSAGRAQIEAGEGQAIAVLVQRWAEAHASGEVAVARARAEVLEREAFAEIANEMIQTGSIEAGRELLRRLENPGWSELTSAALAAAKSDADTGFETVVEAGRRLLKPLADVADGIGDVAKVAAWGLGFIGLARLVNAARGKAARK